MVVRYSIIMMFLYGIAPCMGMEGEKEDAAQQDALDFKKEFKVSDEELKIFFQKLDKDTDDASTMWYELRERFSTKVAHGLKDIGAKSRYDVLQHWQNVACKVMLTPGEDGYRILSAERMDNEIVKISKYYDFIDRIARPFLGLKKRFIDDGSYSVLAKKVTRICDDFSYTIAYGDMRKLSEVASHIESFFKELQKNKKREGVAHDTTE